MPVEFTCDGCNRRLRAPDSKAGKRTNCPTCGKDLQIPVMGASPPITLPTAGLPVLNPLDKLAAAIPTASEAAAGFNLSKPSSPQSVGQSPVTVRPQAEPIEIGLANDDPPPAASPSSSSSSGIGNSSKSKANAWRGGEKASVATAPASSAPTSNPMGLSIPAKPSAAAPSPLIPVASTAPNPLDDIFKDIPQLAPVNTGPQFGNLRPVATTDPFAFQGASLPQAAAQRWDQIAASASVSSNPYASPSASGARGYGRSASIESVRPMVMIPGIFLLVYYIFLLLGTTLRIGLTVVGLVLISSDESIRNQVSTQTGGIGIAMEVMFAILFFVLSIAGLFGAIKMIRIRSRSTAMTAAVMAIFPFCLCFPIGIWAVVVLSQESVQRAFDANDRRHGG
jgi:hypothetical protein